MIHERGHLLEERPKELFDFAGSAASVSAFSSIHPTIAGSLTRSENGKVGPAVEMPAALSIYRWEPPNR